MEYMSCRQVSEKLNVHEKTVRRYINNGDLQAVKIGGHWKIKPSWLERFLQEDSCTEMDYCVFMDSEKSEGIKHPRCLIMDEQSIDQAQALENKMKSMAYDIMKQGRTVNILRQGRRVVLWCEEEDLKELINA